MMRTYTSMASLSKDRARAISVMSLGLAMGTVIGPGEQVCDQPKGPAHLVIQLGLNPIGYPGIRVWRSLGLSMYTAPALICASSNVISLLVMLLIFEEVYAEPITVSGIRQKMPTLQCDFQ